MKRIPPSSKLRQEVEGVLYGWETGGHPLDNFVRLGANKKKKGGGCPMSFEVHPVFRLCNHLHFQSCMQQSDLRPDLPPKTRPVPRLSNVERWKDEKPRRTINKRSQAHGRGS